jgi:hypothetical protein
MHLLERESTVEHEAARAGKPVHLMRLFFTDSQFKLVPLESSYSLNIFANSSPPLLEINSALIPIQARTRFKKDRQAQTRVAVLSIPGINAGAFRTVTVNRMRRRVTLEDIPNLASSADQNRPR